MKRICFISGIVVCLLCGVYLYIHAGTNTEAGSVRLANIEVKVPEPHDKVLVAYFSVPQTDGVDASSGASRLVENGKLYGNTEYIARIISEATGGDLFAIKTEQIYPGSGKALVDAARKEQTDGARPKLATHIGNLKDYDVIFVGYPNWWFDMPMPLYTFFEEYDFKGKTIIPFCTHGGSRFSQSVETIVALEKNATVVKGPSVTDSGAPQARQRIYNWLREQNLVKQ